MRSNCRANWLNRDAYLAVQLVCYPGFTFGGASEPLSIVAILALLIATPAPRRSEQRFSMIGQRKLS